MIFNSRFEVIQRKLEVAGWSVKRAGFYFDIFLPELGQQPAANKRSRRVADEMNLQLAAGICGQSLQLFRELVDAASRLDGTSHILFHFGPDAFADHAT